MSECERLHVALLEATQGLSEAVCVFVRSCMCIYHKLYVYLSEAIQSQFSSHANNWNMKNTSYLH